MTVIADFFPPRSSPARQYPRMEFRNGGKNVIAEALALSDVDYIELSENGMRKGRVYIGTAVTKQSAPVSDAQRRCILATLDEQGCNVGVIARGGTVYHLSTHDDRDVQVCDPTTKKLKSLEELLRPTGNGGVPTTSPAPAG